MIKQWSYSVSSKILSFTIYQFCSFPFHSVWMQFQWALFPCSETEKQMQPGGLSSWFGACVHVSWVLQTASSWDSTGICSGGFLGVSALKTILQKIYHWMIEHHPFARCRCGLRAGSPSLAGPICVCSNSQLTFGWLGLQFGFLSQLCLVSPEKWHRGNYCMLDMLPWSVWHPQIALPWRRHEKFTWSECL